MSQKTKSTGIIKFTAVKDYINETKGMRSKQDAVDQLIAEFDAALDAVIDEAKRLAQAGGRNTILKPDVAAALDKYLGRKDLPWDETAKEVIKHNPTDLGKISKTLHDWIKEREDAGQEKK